MTLNKHNNDSYNYIIYIASYIHSEMDMVKHNIQLCICTYLCMYVECVFVFVQLCEDSP